ncbi:MAG: MBL fold metallo-hydrolase [Clostridia bacterium]|nr:MBL fold metallo-hydrolase [Clostridia bacterium]
MVGVSLSPGIFSPKNQTETNQKLIDEFGGLKQLFLFLKGLGVSHIELRSVSPQDPSDEIYNLAEILWSNGFEITVHASLPTEIAPFSLYWSNLLPLLKKAKTCGKTTVITVHSAVSGDDSNKAPAAKKTNDILRLWSSEVQTLGAKIALEINRDKQNGDPSVTCSGVLEMISGTDPNSVGICFDFGHYFSNVRQKGEASLPSEEFLRRVIHTHIHALKNGKTHFPLGSDAELPLPAYTEALVKAGYNGVFNFEPDFPRYTDLSFREAIRSSITKIKGAKRKAAPFDFAERKNYAAAIENAYPSELERISREIEASKDDSFWTLCPSGQFFSVNGVKFAIDPAFRSEKARNHSLNAMREVLRQADFILTTHEHDDHFDADLASNLRDLPVTWVFGENFSTELLQKAKLKEENVKILSFNSSQCLGKTHIQCFKGSHFAADGSGVPSAMFYVDIGGKSVFFPADVRDYGADKLPNIPSPDLMFANIWLGRGKAENTPQGAYEEFCDYIAFFHPKKIFLGHLYEYTRSNKNMWKYEHAGKVMDGLAVRLPGTVAVPLLPFCKYNV